MKRKRSEEKRWLAASFALSGIGLVGCGGENEPEAKLVDSEVGSALVRQTTPSDSAVEPPGPRPVVIFRPNPDWSSFPTGHLPAAHGVYELHINEKGRVDFVKVVRPAHPKVDQEMVRTLRRWRFEPARQDGRAVSVNFTVTVTIDPH